MTQAAPAKVTKLNRVERNAWTKRKIFDAATKIVGKYGYAEASVARALVTLSLAPDAWVVAGSPVTLVGRPNAGVPADLLPATLEVAISDGYFEVEMRQHGLLRPLSTAELSDGTLRYLLLVAALLSPRPPMLMILNEPETSLHPDLLPPLARLIAKASERSQIVVVSHALSLVDGLRAAGAKQIVLTKELGETIAQGEERQAWNWPTR